MDPNRNPLDAYANETDDAHISYQDYHNLIESHFKHDHFGGLIVDLHGHSHAEDWIELGYCLSRADLNHRPLTTARSSIDALANHNKYILDEIVRGPDTSIGGLLQMRYNLKCVPSHRTLAPAHNANYYSGGYITETHGRGRFGAVQVEVPASLRSDENVDLFAKQLASVLFEFYYIHSLDTI